MATLTPAFMHEYGLFSFLPLIIIQNIQVPFFYIYLFLRDVFFFSLVLQCFVFFFVLLLVWIPGGLFEIPGGPSNTHLHWAGTKNYRPIPLVHSILDEFINIRKKEEKKSWVYVGYVYISLRLSCLLCVCVCVLAVNWTFDGRGGRPGGGGWDTQEGKTALGSIATNRRYLQR